VVTEGFSYNQKDITVSVSSDIVITFIDVCFRKLPIGLDRKNDKDYKKLIEELDLGEQYSELSEMIEESFF
jgi:hypothetical protein